MWQYNYSDELCHHGILGMKWGQHKASRIANTNSMYKSNKKISNDFKNSKGQKDSYEKTMSYAGNKATQLYLRRSDRSKMYADLNDKNKNRGVSMIKAILKTGIKDTAVSSLPASVVGIGLSTVTGNPLLGITVGSLVGKASAYGIAGTRIYNTAKNK